MAEGASLTFDERKRMAETWLEASNGRLEVIVHVGTNCIKDAQDLVNFVDLHSFMNYIPLIWCHFCISLVNLISGHNRNRTSTE